MSGGGEKTSPCRHAIAWAPFPSTATLLELFGVPVAGFRGNEEIIKEIVQKLERGPLLRIGIPTLSKGRQGMRLSRVKKSAKREQYLEHNVVDRFWTVAIGRPGHPVAALNLLYHFSIVHACETKKRCEFQISDDYRRGKNQEMEL